LQQKAKAVALLGPTLIIDDKIKNKKEKDDNNNKSEIDRLLDSDEDSPRFGQKKGPKKQELNSSVDDIFDALDGGGKKKLD